MNKELSIGDYAIITNKGRTYTAYDVMAELMQLERFCHMSTENGDIVKIVAKRKHQDETIDLFGVEYPCGIQSILDIEGLTKTEVVFGRTSLIKFEYDKNIFYGSSFEKMKKIIIEYKYLYNIKSMSYLTIDNKEIMEI